MKKHLIAVLAFAWTMALLEPSQVCAIEKPGRDPEVPIKDEELSIVGIKSYIQKNNIKDIELFLKQLPATMLGNFTLIEKSRSRQPSQSAEFPRLILYTPNGKFYIGISTDSSIPDGNYNDVEMLEFTSDGKWAQQAVTLDGMNKASFHTGSNSTRGRCTDCHGPHNRPIWGSYNTWPGAFNESMTKTQAEQLTKALTDGHKNKRLQSLNFPKKVWSEGETLSLADQKRGYANEALNQVIATRQIDFLRKESSQKKHSDLLMIASICDHPDVANIFSLELRGRISNAVEKLWQENPELKKKYPQAYLCDKALALNGMDPHYDLLLDRTLPECSSENAPVYYFSDWSATTSSLRFLLFERAFHEWRRLRDYRFNEYLVDLTYYDNYDYGVDPTGKTNVAKYLDRWMHATYNMDNKSLQDLLVRRPYYIISASGRPMFGLSAQLPLALRQELLKFTEDCLKEAEK